MNTKIVALYLPQFHETPYNNKWWGEGYTDWVATKRSKPLFKGHQQPRIPLDHNYYDLAEENAETLKWQAKIAKEHGVDAFCLYHYFFDKTPYLDTPLKILREHEEIDIEYCFCWDPGTWRRTWVGSPNANEVLLQQKYGDETTWTEHYKYLRTYFLDKRYMLIDNKPIFGFYISRQVESLKEMKDCWDRLAREDGFDGIYFFASDDENRGDEYFEPLDAFYNYEPKCAFAQQTKSMYHFFHLCVGAVKKRLNKWIHTSFYPDKRSAKYIYRRIEKGGKVSSKKEYFGIFSDYDDAPRHGREGVVYCKNNIQLFKKCLKAQLEKSEEYDNELLFVTAWNEWGESAYIEPDENNKYGYLEAIREVKASVNGNA